MKSMQRKFGGLLKRSADEQDVGTVLAEFKQVDEMLDTMLKDLKSWRNSWEDILKLQYDASEAFANIYKPLDMPAGFSAEDTRHQPAATPPAYLQKCLGLQMLYSDLKTDLQQEIVMIDTKLMLPVQEAKAATKSLSKTIKHRENMKLDYERYLSRAEHARKKDQRSLKEETALQQHEANLAQAHIDYQTADDQVKQTFPPVTAAILSLLPYILANQVMLQTTLVGQVYTVLDKYTKTHRMPNPAPSDGAIIDAWEREFTGFRKELEQGIGIIANGQAVKRGMELPVEKGSTYTGLGIRNKAGGLAGKAGGMMPGRKPSGEVPQRPGISSKPSWTSSSGGGGAGAVQRYTGPADDDEGPPPAKPPRPGTNPGYGVGGIPMPSPQIPMGSKPRIPSSSSAASGYGAPPSYEQASAGATPPSRYQTPVGEVPANGHGGYFPSASEEKRNFSAPARSYTNESMIPTPLTLQPFSPNPSSTNPSTSTSSAAGAAAAKKKPPPPIPQKRIPSQQAQFVTALYDFEGQSPGDLVFREGDRIRVVRKTESVDDWWEGEVGGRVGAFPANYVQL